MTGHIKKFFLFEETNELVSLGLMEEKKQSEDLKVDKKKEWFSGITK